MKKKEGTQHKSVKSTVHVFELNIIKINDISINLAGSWEEIIYISFVCLQTNLPKLFTKNPKLKTREIEKSWEQNKTETQKYLLLPDKQILSSDLFQDQPLVLSLLPFFLYIFCNTEREDCEKSSIIIAKYEQMTITCRNRICKNQK